MGKYPYYRKFPKDFLGDGKVRSLSPDATAYYSLLLDNIWEYDTQYSIPDDPNLIAALLKITPERWLTFREEFISKKVLRAATKSGRLISKRLKIEFEILAKKSETQRKNILRRYNRGSTNGLPKGYLSDSDSDSEPNKKTPLPPKGTPPAKPKEDIPFAEIIAHLNARAGMSYRPQTKSTQAHIRARWGEGYRLEQFNQVIDHKCREWKGTEWEKFLCPDTLFGTKFEKYLQQSQGREAKADAEVERVLQLARAEREGRPDISGDASSLQAEGAGSDDS